MKRNGLGQSRSEVGRKEGGRGIYSMTSSFVIVI